MPPKKKAEPAKRGRDGEKKSGAQNAKPKSVAQQIMDGYLDFDAERRDQAEKQLGGVDRIELGLGLDRDEVNEIKSLWEFSKDTIINSYNRMFGAVYLSKEKRAEAAKILHAKLPLKASTATLKTNELFEYSASIITAIGKEVLPGIKKIFNPARASRSQENEEQKKAWMAKWGKSVIPKSVEVQSQQFHLAMGCFSIIRDLEVTCGGEDFFDDLAEEVEEESEELIETVYTLFTLIRSMIGQKGWMKEIEKRKEAEKNEKKKDGSRKVSSSSTTTTGGSGGKKSDSELGTDFGIASCSLELLDNLCRCALVRIYRSIPEPESEAQQVLSRVWKAHQDKLAEGAKKEAKEALGGLMIGEWQADFDDHYADAQADDDEDTFLQTECLDVCFIKTEDQMKTIYESLAAQFAGCPWHGLTARGNHIFQCIHRSQATKLKELKTISQIFGAVAVCKLAMSYHYDYWFTRNEEAEPCRDLLSIFDKLLKVLNPGGKWLVEDDRSPVEGALKPTKQCVATAFKTVGMTSASVAALVRWLKIQKHKVEAIAGSGSDYDDEEEEDDDDEEEDEGWETVEEDDE